MAETEKSVVKNAGKENNNLGNFAGFGRRRGQRSAGPDLDKRQRFALGVVLQAKKACALFVETARAGEEIPGEVLQACSVLSGTIGQMLAE